MFKQRVKLKKIVFFGFFAAFLIAFLSVNDVNAGLWNWFEIYGDDNVAATTASSKTYTLRTNKSGSGTITSSDGNINCGLDCSEKYSFSPITTVTLTATPASGHSFNKWDGGGCGSSKTCTVKMTESITVTAKFKKKNPQEESKKRTLNHFNSSKATASTYKLKVTMFGKGRIKDNFSKIDCGSNMTCEADYSKGQVVRIKAQDNNSSGVSYKTKVESWDGGGCGGASNYCDITMNGDREVRVNFVTKTSITYKLKVTVSGNGRIQDNYSKINCGSNMVCEATYSEGRMIRIKTENTDSDGKSFGTKIESWSGGGCSGTSNSCDITMDGDKEVTIKFVSK